jgi:thiamine biosynthesis lipoprotein ApbE
MRTWREKFCLAIGERPDGSDWRVGIQHPRKADCTLGLVSVKDEAIVTSVDYQRFLMDGTGRRCHHILDPTIGYPARSGVESNSVRNIAHSDADVRCLGGVRVDGGRK